LTLSLVSRIAVDERRDGDATSERDKTDGNNSTADRHVYISFSNINAEVRQQSADFSNFVVSLVGPRSQSIVVSHAFASANVFLTVSKVKESL
jgi:hypothetical protein